MLVTILDWREVTKAKPYLAEVIQQLHTHCPSANSYKDWKIDRKVLYRSEFWIQLSVFEWGRNLKLNSFLQPSAKIFTVDRAPTMRHFGHDQHMWWKDSLLYADNSDISKIYYCLPIYRRKRGQFSRPTFLSYGFSNPWTIVLGSFWCPLLYSRVSKMLLKIQDYTSDCLCFRRVCQDILLPN